MEIGCQETEVGGKVRGRTAWEYTLILTRAACKAASDSSQHSSTSGDGYGDAADAEAAAAGMAATATGKLTIYVIIIM